MARRHPNHRTGNPVGRPRYQPTEQSRAQVAALKAFGVPNERIAEFLEISSDTLVKYYQYELENSVEHANMNVANFLFHAASGQALRDGASHADCIRAAIFWAKTRMGWREITRIDYTQREAPDEVRIVPATPQDALPTPTKEDGDVDAG